MDHPTATTHHFGCTICGKCCADLRVPLSLEEAAAWAGRGHAVEILCDASPWAVEPPTGDLAVAYRRERSFAASCGALPVRVSALLVASFQGPCPNRMPDIRCAIYAERPMVCRLYPAEFNPTVAFDPANKQCPPEAWAESWPPLMRDGEPADEGLRALIERCRATAVADTALKPRLCADLGIRTAGLTNEGYAVHRPDPDRLRAALRACLEDSATGPEDGGDWTIASNREGTLDTLSWMDARGERTTAGDDYLGFFPDET